MDFTLRHWVKPGKPERIYLNDYAEGATIHVERSDAGLAVKAFGGTGPAVDPAKVLADLKTRFSIRDLTWESLVKAAGRPAPPARVAPPPPGKGAMDTALLAVGLGGRPLATPATIVAGPSVPEPALAMLSNLRNLSVERGTPEHCDLAIPGQLAFVLCAVADLARDGSVVMAEARARDLSHAASYLVVEGDPASLGDRLSAASINLARLSTGSRTVVVPAVSPAHAGFMVACLVREALASEA
jgi:hypothetical protein